MKSSNKERDYYSSKGKFMKRYSTTVITKDGYVITRHAISLNPYCRYTIIKPNGIKIGWFSYRQVFGTLAILRLFE